MVVTLIEMNVNGGDPEVRDARPSSVAFEPIINHTASETIFHAVHIPPETLPPIDGVAPDIVRVFSDKSEALKVIREHKTGRLRSFKKRADAEQFARTGYELSNTCNENPLSASTVSVEEKSNNFKTPKPQDLVRFRKLIECGDLEQASNIINENPRYLVSSGDTPAILQEGCRYNALHIAVKACRANMCELILSTIGDATFMKLLYGKDDIDSYVDRSQILLDLYLNTPDKGLNETPLHFAAKFGLRDIVQILVSYPQCDRRLQNKYGQTAVDMICSRKCQENEELKREIRILLEEQYYVPVLRTEGNIVQATIGEPFSPARPPNLNVDPISPRLEVRAFAGPMPRDRAIEFRKKWKTPPRKCTTPVKRTLFDEVNVTSSPPVSLALRLQDAEKGLERIGRDLAEEYHVPWKEYWPFLNDFADLRGPEGLARFEDYMKERLKTKSIVHRQTLESLCDKLSECSLLTESADTLETGPEEFYTPPSSPSSARDSSEDEMSSAEEGTPTFIEGALPTKLDYAVYNAIPGSIDREVHPSIYLWQHEIKLAIRKNTFDFRDTGSSRRKLHMTRGRELEKE